MDSNASAITVSSLDLARLEALLDSAPARDAEGTAALRRELAGTGVEVTHISPRAVRTSSLSPAILRFADATGMHLDRPEIVADRIVEAIVDGKRELRIGLPERLFALINSLAPALADRALAGNDRKAAALFR